MKEQLTPNNKPKRNERIFANTSDSHPELDWNTTAADLMLDLKVLMKEYYIATFTESGDALKISFKNGQSFLLSIKTCA